MESNHPLNPKDYLAIGKDKEISKSFESDEFVVFSDTITKYNDFNWKQLRVMLITNKYLYNIKKKKIQRKIALNKIKAITKCLQGQSHELVIHIPSEYDYRYIAEKCEEIINCLQIYEQNIQIYAVPATNLKDYVTSKSDMKKKISKIPPENFHINKITSAISPIHEMETVLFETHKKTGKTVYEKRKSVIQAQLSDFKILKLIGKGTFGTVFLVEKDDTKEIFAFKQLRKDVMIKEGQIESSKLEKNILQSSDHPFLA